MGLSDIFRRIKSALGIGGSRRQQPPQGQYQQGQPQQGQAQQPAGGQQQGTNVTVEREPSTETEDAVKGTDTEPETTDDSESEHAIRDSEEEDSEEEVTEDSAVESTDESEVEAAEESGDSETDLGTDEPTDVIKGIGSAYAERLAEAGVETVADLARSDAEPLSEETGISETRLQNWIDRAKHR